MYAFHAKNCDPGKQSKTHEGAAERLGAISAKPIIELRLPKAGESVRPKWRLRIEVSQRAYAGYLHGCGPASARVAFDILGDTRRQRGFKYYCAGYAKEILEMEKT